MPGAKIEEISCEFELVGTRIIFRFEDGKSHSVSIPSYVDRDRVASSLELLALEIRKYKSFEKKRLPYGDADEALKYYRKISKNK